MFIISSSCAIYTLINLPEADRMQPLDILYYFAYLFLPMLICIPLIYIVLDLEAHCGRGEYISFAADQRPPDPRDWDVESEEEMMKQAVLAVGVALSMVGLQMRHRKWVIPKTATATLKSAQVKSDNAQTAATHTCTLDCVQQYIKLLLSFALITTSCTSHTALAHVRTALEQHSFMCFMYSCWNSSETLYATPTL